MHLVLAATLACTAAAGALGEEERLAAVQLAERRLAAVAYDRSECAVCSVGCAPYSDPATGHPVWTKTVEEMGRQCDVMIHLGDTKSGGAPCTYDTMVGPLNVMQRVARASKRVLLYAVGDNEMTDCHRGYYREGQTPNFVAGDSSTYFLPKSTVLNSEAARNIFIDEFDLTAQKDLTGAFEVHTQSDECPFHKYIEKCNMAVVTLEVPGSDWGLAGGGAAYPKMDEVDPISERIAGYVRAKDCALAWIDESVSKAKAAGLQAVLLHWQANIFQWSSSYSESIVSNAGMIDSDSPVSQMVDTDNDGVSDTYSAFGDLVEKIKTHAVANPDMVFYGIHSDWHYWRISKPYNDVENYIDVMSEGQDHGLTSFAKFSFTPDALDPVVVKKVSVDPTGPMDSADWHKKNNPSKNCVWVASYAAKRCHVRGADQTDALTGCARTCDGMNEPHPPHLPPDARLRTSPSKK